MKKLTAALVAAFFLLFSVSAQARISDAQKKQLPHPAGCPRVLFCACGAAVEVFGKPIRSLWSVSSWTKYPKTAPAAGMVATRSHHIFTIKEVLGPNKVLAIDHNGGGGKSWLHVVSLKGYTVRNPRG